MSLTNDSLTGFLGFGLSTLAAICLKNCKKEKSRGLVQSALDTWCSSEMMPMGQLLILRGDKELFYGTAGFANEKKEEILRDTLFRIYSMTKPITVVAALILVDRGKLSLDDSVAKYIPSFANGRVFVGGDENNPQTEPVLRDMTVRDLMMHTSGLTYGIFGASPVDLILQRNVGEDWKNFYKNTTLESLCDAAGRTPLSFQPGTKWQYGLSTDVLGRVIEVVSGCKLDLFFQDEIFKPLGMNDTSFYVQPSDLSRLVDCYDFKATSGFELSHVPERDRSKQPVFLAGGGGLVSTITDYSRFVKSLFTGSKSCLLHPSTLKMMHSNLLPNNKNLIDVGADGFSEISGPGVGFGLGVSVITDPSAAYGAKLSSPGEFGWGGLASTYFFVDPVKNLAAIFFSQVIPSTKLAVRPQLRWLTHRLNDEMA